MEKQIKEKFNDGILQGAAQAFGAALDEVKLLDGFESFIYEYPKQGKDYILRIGHSSRRSVDMIQGEIDWINYLSDNGVNAARAVPSENQNFVEAVDDGNGEYFLAASFVKAKGKLDKEHLWKPPLWEHYGQQIGRMHELSHNYTPPNPAWKRPEWDDPINLNVVSWIPKDQQIVLKKNNTLMEHLEALPKDAASYGLIHQDAHRSNFFVDDLGQMTLFDFDDCCYGWYAYDLAMVIFYNGLDADPKEFQQNFLVHFMTGYRQETTITQEWLAEIPYFLKLREIDLYGVIHRSFDVDNLDDSWVQMYMDGRREKIEQEIPFLDIDFTQI
jgi:Ser/Thr protein kinase RdoA (MazF antagonist)